MKCVFKLIFNNVKMGLSTNYNYAQIARDSGFKFKQFSDDEMDWKNLESTNINKLISEQNFEKIEEICFCLAEAPLSTKLNTEILDSNVEKYFILQQLSIQYLLFCFSFLDETVLTLKYLLRVIQSERNNYKQLYGDNCRQLKELHKKIHHFESLNKIIFQCSTCNKYFIDNDMLTIHIEKTHRKEWQQQSNFNRNNSIADKNLIHTIKLELEVKQLKEKINNITTQRSHLTEDSTDTTVAPIKYKQLSINNSYLGNFSNAETQTTTCAINNIAIQNNLDEKEEKSDVGNTDEKLNINNKNNSLFKKFKDQLLTRTSDKNNEYNQIQSNETQKKLNKKLETIETIISKQNEERKHFYCQDNNSFKTIQAVINNNTHKYHQSNEIKVNETAKKFENYLKQNLQEVEEVNQHFRNDNNQEILVLTRNVGSDIKTKIKIGATNINHEYLEVNDKNLIKNRLSSEVISKAVKEAVSDKSTSLISSDHNIISGKNHLKKKSSITKSFTNSNFPWMALTSNNLKNLNNIKEFTVNDALRIMHSNLKIFGIKSNSNQLTYAIKYEISKKITEKRKSRKIIYPEFLKTRSELKLIVRKLSLKQMKMKSTREETISQAVPNHIASDPNIENKTEKQSSEEEMNEFKLRLNKIIDSPVRVFYNNNKYNSK